MQVLKLMLTGIIDSKTLKKQQLFPYLCETIPFVKFMFNNAVIRFNVGRLFFLAFFLFFISIPSTFSQSTVLSKKLTGKVITLENNQPVPLQLSAF